MMRHGFFPLGGERGGEDGREDRPETAEPGHTLFPRKEIPFVLFTRGKCLGIFFGNGRTVGHGFRIQLAFVGVMIGDREKEIPEEGELGSLKEFIVEALDRRIGGIRRRRESLFS